MAARTPAIGQSPLDSLPEYTVTDLAQARVALLGDADAYQFALMNRWGGPDYSIAMQMIDGGTTWTGSGYEADSNTYAVTVPVPAGARYADIELLVSGRSKCAITSDYDSTGTLFDWNVSDSRSLSKAEWRATVGIVSTTAGAASKRAVRTRLEPSAVWHDSTLTFVIERTDADDYVDDDSTPGQIHAVALRFIFEIEDTSASITL